MIKSAVVHLDRWLHIYDEVVMRHSGAGCRMPIDQALLEATAIVGGHSRSCEEEPVPCTLNIYTRMRLFAELDLLYKPPQLGHPQSPVVACSTEAAAPSPLHRPIVYTGRFDYCIGFCCSPRVPLDPVVGPHSTLQASHLCIAEAKMVDGVVDARRQLLAYVGCIHHMHGRRNAGKRDDCTSYGVASDGYTVYSRYTHT